MEEELEEDIISTPAISGCSYTLPLTMQIGTNRHQMGQPSMQWPPDVLHQMLDQEDGTHVSDNTDDVEMTESFDQNQATTDMLDFIVQSTMQEANHDQTVHHQDKNSKLYNVCSSTSTRPCKGKFGDIPWLTATKKTKRSLHVTTPSPIEPYYTSLCERHKARSVERMTPADLQLQRDPYFHQRNMAWQLCHFPPIKIVELESDHSPGWNAFFPMLTPTALATCIGYGPMIPSGPTDPSVVHKGLEYVVKLDNKFGMNHTVVMADQALYEIVFGLECLLPDADANSAGHMYWIWAHDPFWSNRS